MRPEPPRPSPFPSRAPSPEELVGLLADRHRRNIVQTLEQGPLPMSAVTGATGVPARQVADGLVRLAHAGVVTEHEDGTYELVEDIFERSARDAALERLGDLNDFDTRLYRRFFYRNRLLEVPTEPEALQTVLTLVAEDFRPGQTYDEREVNTALYGWHGDWALLRRLLVDHGYLTRDRGVYRRTETRPAP